MYKGKFFKESVFRKDSPTSEEKKRIIRKNKYRYRTYHRVMEFLPATAYMIVFISFVLSCISSSTVQGMPSQDSSNSSKDCVPNTRLVPNTKGLHTVFAHPTLKATGQLQSRTGYFLEILPNGTIQATLNNSSIYTKIEMQSYNRTLKRIKGVQSAHFLACEIRFRRRGKFIGRSIGIPLTTDSLFEEHLEQNGYTTYRAFSFPKGCNNTGYLAIKENGKFRRIDRSTPGMHASQFTFIASN